MPRHHDQQPASKSLHSPEVSTVAAGSDVLDWSGSVRAVAVMRMAMGLITLLHLRPFLRDAAHGVSYTDHFWHPFIPWLPELSDRAWSALLWIGAAAAVLTTIGLWTRLATLTMFTVVAGNLLLSTTHFRHNRAFLVIVLGGLALLPTGRVLSIDAWRRRRTSGSARSDVVALWPLGCCGFSCASSTWRRDSAS